MIFPFTLTLSKKIKGETEKYSINEILNHVSNKFKESDADHVKMIDNLVIVKNNIFNFFIIKRGGNTNRWGGISEAKFKITEMENTRKVFYTINLTSILVVGLITGIIGSFLGNYKINRTLSGAQRPAMSPC
jgi:hypothetical protein